LNRAPEIIDLLDPDLQGIKFDIEESVLQQK